MLLQCFSSYQIPCPHFPPLLTNVPQFPLHLQTQPQLGPAWPESGLGRVGRSLLGLDHY